MRPRKDWHFERTQTRARRLTSHDQGMLGVSRTQSCTFSVVLRAIFSAKLDRAADPLQCYGAEQWLSYYTEALYFRVVRLSVRPRMRSIASAAYKCITWHIRRCLSRARVWSKSRTCLQLCQGQWLSHRTSRTLSSASHVCSSSSCIASPLFLIRSNFQLDAQRAVFLQIKNNREVIYLRTSLFAVSWKFQKKAAGNDETNVNGEEVNRLKCVITVRNILIFLTDFMSTGMFNLPP